MRRLDVRHPVPGPAPAALERFVDDPGEWLPGPARWRGEATWIVTLWAGPATRTVECRVGPVWTVGGDRWRSLSWTPTPGPTDPLPVDRALPSLTGELGLEVSGGTSLVLHATYRPPGGPAGRAVDAVALHGVAAHTALRFLDEVAAGLTRAAPAHRHRAPLP
jgi:hypothetical protein